MASALFPVIASTLPSFPKLRRPGHHSEERGLDRAASDLCAEPAAAASQAAPEWDISRGPRKTGALMPLSMVVPAATRVATSTMGGLLAATGYAAGKLGEVVGTGKAVDSLPFQAGLQAWMWSQGIFPKVVYEPLGEAGEQLAALTCSDQPEKEDMRITPFIVSNHTSYIDGLVLASVFQGPKIVAMSGTRKIPVIGQLMEEMGTVFVDRASGDSKKATLEAIAAHSASWQTGSRPLLIFPEGRTTNGKMLTDFKKGAFVSGQPVRPVIIVYTGHFDPATTTYHQRRAGGKLHETSDAEWAAQFMGHFIHSMHVRVLPPYLPSEAEQSDANLYARGCKEYMDRELQRVRREVEACSWKAAAGRAEGGLDFKFGDVRKVVAKRVCESAEGLRCIARHH